MLVCRRFGRLSGGRVSGDAPLHLMMVCSVVSIDGDDDGGGNVHTPSTQRWTLALSIN